MSNLSRGHWARLYQRWHCILMSVYRARAVSKCFPVAEHDRCPRGACLVNKGKLEMCLQHRVYQTWAGMAGIGMKSGRCLGVEDGGSLGTLRR